MNSRLTFWPALARSGRTRANAMWRCSTGEYMLGPYPSKAAAENWRDTVAARNEAWDAEDDRWEHQGEK